MGGHARDLPVCRRHAVLLAARAGPLTSGRPCLDTADNEPETRLSTRLSSCQTADSHRTTDRAKRRVLFASGPGGRGPVHSVPRQDWRRPG